MKDNKNLTPNKREKVVNYLLEIIEQKKNLEDKSLPSERFLITKFKVSRGTIRTTFADLKIKGLIRSVKGAGYFINEDINFAKINSVRNKMSTSSQQILIDAPINLENLVSILMKLKIKFQNVNIYDFVSYIKVFYVNQKPERYSKSFVNEKLFTKLDFKKIESSLMQFIVGEGIKPEKSISLIEIQKKNDLDQKILIDDQQTLIVTKYSVLYSQSGKIIEISEHRTNLKAFSTSYIKIL